MPRSTAYLCSTCGSLMSLQATDIKTYKSARLIKGINNIVKCPYCITKKITVKDTTDYPRVLGSSGTLLSKTEYKYIKPLKREELRPELNKPLSYFTKQEIYWFDNYKKRIVPIVKKWEDSGEKSSSKSIPYLDKDLIEKAWAALTTGKDPNFLSELFDNQIEENNPKNFLLAVILLIKENFLHMAEGNL